jgi:GTP-binding protein Era
MSFKAGFVNIIGLPNVGKSSLVNYLIDDHLSIVNSKSQTTRHSIRGFISNENHQIILVDTPGWIENPAYQLQTEMNKCVDLAFEEGDIILLVVDKFNSYNESHHIIQTLNKTNAKIIVLLNKIDLYKPEEIIDLQSHYQQIIPNADFYAISTTEKIGKEVIIEKILEYLPNHPPYFDIEEWTDRNTRFFVSEMIRERIFSNYQKEIPYSTEVVVEKYKEKEDQSVLIEATIFVERSSQKNILIGHEGEKIKKVSIESRDKISNFLGQKVHLFLFVKVLDNWRNKENVLKKFGYLSK